MSLGNAVSDSNQHPQINYSLQLITPVLRGFARSFEVTPEATNNYNDIIQTRLAKSVFILCSSWYRTGRTGKVFSIFPGPVSLFWWWSRTVTWGHYRTVGGEGWVLKQRAKAAVIRLAAVVVLVSGLVWSSSRWPDVARMWARIFTKVFD